MMIIMTIMTTMTMIIKVTMVEMEVYSGRMSPPKWTHTWITRLSTLNRKQERKQEQKQKQKPLA
jgi:hypothetical protein